MIFSSVSAAPMWLLNDLFVTSEARGQGIGAALLERARIHAKETGACQLMPETGKDNPARNLYERCGWEPVSERRFLCSNAELQVTLGAGLPRQSTRQSVVEGNGMYSSWSSGIFGKRPACQSALACSMRSARLETKFHSI